MYNATIDEISEKYILLSLSGLLTIIDIENINTMVLIIQVVKYFINALLVLEQQKFHSIFSSWSSVMRSTPDPHAVSSALRGVSSSSISIQ